MPVDPAVPQSIDPDRRMAERLAALERRVNSLESVLQGGVLAAIPVVTALPAGHRKGRLVMLDTDKQVYKDTGTVWVSIG